MCLQKKMNPYTDDYFTKISQTKEKIENAERLVIGVGAGLPASGGLNYGDPELAKKWYPEYYSLGKKTIGEIMQDFWITPQINPNEMTKFWGFWAQHIYHIRYEAGVLEPYTNLAKIAKDKEYFICTTNVDGQLAKAGFDTRKIFAPQGDYALFQCEVPCSQDVYDNKESIYQMVNNMQSPFEINPMDVPHCPRCGKFLIPNLRCDDRFVEAPHLKNLGAYQNFLHDSKNKKTVFLELGVGYNTPTIIRFPFEQMTLKDSNATLIRINQDYAGVPQEITEQSICFQNDSSDVLSTIVNV